MAEELPIPPSGPTPDRPELHEKAPPGPSPAPTKAALDLDALFPMPQGKGLGHVADKWQVPPGRVNAILIAISVVGMVSLAPSLFRFAFSPAPDSETSLFNYQLLLKLIVFLGCMGFFCAAAGFRFAHWLAQKITDLIFGMNEGPPPDRKD